MIISFSSNYKTEKKYITDVLFNSFLSIKYEIEIGNVSDYIIEVNSKKIILGDVFFAKKETDNTPYSFENIPKCISMLQYKRHNIISLFGENKISIEKNTITIHSDIFASAFFMLTRWEEKVNLARDRHNRFPASESIAYKHNFLHRPVVNEYVEFLWDILKEAGYKGEQKKREFKLIPTHDIDDLFFWRGKNILKRISGDLIKRKYIRLAFHNIANYIKSKANHTYDLYNTYAYFMKLAENAGSKAVFFFMAGGDTIYDKRYEIRQAKEIINDIINKDHIVGIHPSYNAYNSVDLLKEEIQNFANISKKRPANSRNHYLRFEIPKTWQLLDATEIKYDYSMYYSDTEGFRCGTCYEFPVFDIENRKVLNIIEYALIVMDTTLLKLKQSDVEERIIKLKETVKKYNGNFVFLWHNSNVNTPETLPYKQIFETAFYG